MTVVKFPKKDLPEQRVLFTATLSNNKGEVSFEYPAKLSKDELMQVLDSMKSRILYERYDEALT